MARSGKTVLWMGKIEGRKQKMTLKELIKQSDNIVFFGGAGVSTESGIPDFRSETGIYNTIKRYKRSPE